MHRNIDLWVIVRCSASQSSLRLGFAKFRGPPIEQLDPQFIPKQHPVHLIAHALSMLSSPNNFVGLHGRKSDDMTVFAAANAC